MDTASVAHQARPATPDLEHVGLIAARVLRGLALYEGHADAIRFGG